MPGQLGAEVICEPRRDPRSPRLRMLTWTVLVVSGVLRVAPAVADDTPISLRIGLRTGVEGGSTVTLDSDPDRHEGLLLLGLDADSFVERYVLGGGLSVGGGPGTYGSVRAGVHAGVSAPTTSVRATATVELGIQSLSHICPFLHSDPCGSAMLPFAGLRASFGYAFEHVEVALWTQLVVDSAAITSRAVTNTTSVAIRSAAVCWSRTSDADRRSIALGRGTIASCAENKSGRISADRFCFLVEPRGIEPLTSRVR